MTFTLNKEGERIGQAAGVAEFDLVFDRLYALIDAALKECPPYEGYRFSAGWDGAFRDAKSGVPLLSRSVGGYFEITERALELIELMQWFCKGQAKLGIGHCLAVDLIEA